MYTSVHCFVVGLVEYMSRFRCVNGVRSVCIKLQGLAGIIGLVYSPFLNDCDG